jgi:hypothetical protein
MVPKLAVQIDYRFLDGSYLRVHSADKAWSWCRVLLLSGCVAYISVSTMSCTTRKTLTSTNRDPEADDDA